MNKKYRSSATDVKVKRVVYMAMDWKFRGGMERLIRTAMVVSCLPNKGLGRREMMLGLVVLRMKVRQ